MVEANLRNDLYKLNLGKARLKCRLLLGRKKVDGGQELADIAVQALMVNICSSLIFTEIVRNKDCMMVHACKQKCLQEQHKEQR